MAEVPLNKNIRLEWSGTNGHKRWIGVGGWTDKFGQRLYGVVKVRRSQVPSLIRQLEAFLDD